MTVQHSDQIVDHHRAMIRPRQPAGTCTATQSIGTACRPILLHERSHAAGRRCLCSRPFGPKSYRTFPEAASPSTSAAGPSSRALIWSAAFGLAMPLPCCTVPAREAASPESEAPRVCLTPANRPVHAVSSCSLPQRRACVRLLAACAAGTDRLKRGRRGGAVRRRKLTAAGV